ncbi:MAG: flagellar filament capping protein FliD [Xanthomonadaceae bacterium]|jgi:flagellar hook-associated protein 2|nr:flagellar filament capping protein FliD [Xanthomonadaceae bacterium]
MASISAAGVGSGLDIQSLVSQLVQAERAPAEGRLQREESSARAQISAFGALRSALSNLGGALRALKPATALDGRRSSSTDATVVTATASAGAAAASYQVEVVSLASAQRLSSGAYASADAVVGTGTLNIGSGTNSFSVTIGASNNTLAGIRDAINGAAGNTSVTASVLNTAEGARLVLTARATGAASAITVTRSGGDGGLDALVYNPGTLTNLQVRAPAADALARIDGFNFTSATNTLSGAVEGVSFNLLAQAPGSAKTVSISRDTESARKLVEGFIASYNTVIGSISAATRYDPATKTASSLTGDALPRALSGEMRRVAGATVQANTTIRTLADVGVTTSVSGALTLDGAKFARAMERNPAEVAALFTGDNGLAARLDAVVQRAAGSGGAIDGRTRGLDERLRGVSERRDALELRMQALEARYRKQFTALDGLVAQLRTTSDFLARQLPA